MPSMNGWKSALAAALVCLLAPGGASAGPLGIAGGYEEFVFGDLSRVNTTANGSVAAGGDAVFRNLRIAGSLVVGGDLSWVNGSLGSGSASVGGVATTKNLGLDGGAKIGTGVEVIDFASSRSYLEAFSKAQYGDGGDARAAYDGYYWYKFGSTDAKGLQVVDVRASDLKGKGLQVAGQAGSTVIVNVLGDSATFSNMQVQLSGGISASNILWNFVDATSLKLSNINWVGTILATKADVNFDNGQLTGALIADSLKGTGTIDAKAGAALFAGDSRSSSTVASSPEPAGVVMLGTALAIGLGVAARRRR